MGERSVAVAVAVCYESHVFTSGHSRTLQVSVSRRTCTKVSSSTIEDGTFHPPGSKYDLWIFGSLDPLGAYTFKSRA